MSESSETTSEASAADTDEAVSYSAAASRFVNEKSDSEISMDSTSESVSDSSSSGAGKGRISPTSFLPEARVRLPLTTEQKQELEAKKNLKKKKPKRKLKLHEMDPEDLMLRASAKGRLDLVDYSLKQNGDIHKCHDEDLYTPLHRASYSGHVDIVKLLVENGANVRAKTLDGWEPLHSACRWGQVAVVSVLLDNGADINALTNGNQTPLHLAALGQDGCETLQFLLKKEEVDCTITNNQGETASDVARRCGIWCEMFEK